MTKSANTKERAAKMTIMGGGGPDLDVQNPLLFPLPLIVERHICDVRI